MRRRHALLQGGMKVWQPKVERFSNVTNKLKLFNSTYYILNMYRKDWVNIVFDVATLGADDLVETPGHRNGRGAQVVDVFYVPCLEQGIFLRGDTGVGTS